MCLTYGRASSHFVVWTSALNVMRNLCFYFSDTVQYKLLEVHDGRIYVVGMTTGSEVKVMDINAEGETSTKAIIAGFLRKDTE